MSTLLDTALSLASRGLHVFPCKPRDKRPAVFEGVKRATTDQNTITGWWGANPLFNIGLACGAQSRVFVVDVDGVDAEAELAKLEQQHDALPPTAESLTARGRHLYFAWPDRPVRNSAGRFHPASTCVATVDMCWHRRAFTQVARHIVGRSTAQTILHPRRNGY